MPSSCVGNGEGYSLYWMEEPTCRWGMSGEDGGDGEVGSPYVKWRMRVT